MITCKNRDWTDSSAAPSDSACLNWSLAIDTTYQVKWQKVRPTGIRRIQLVGLLIYPNSRQLSEKLEKHFGDKPNQGSLERSLSKMSLEDCDRMRNSNRDAWEARKAWCHSSFESPDLLCILQHCWDVPEATSNLARCCASYCTDMQLQTVPALKSSEWQEQQDSTGGWSNRTYIKSLPTLPPTGFGLGQMEAADKKAVTWEKFFSSPRRILISIITHR